MKLTEAQRRVLTRLAGGDEIWTAPWRNASAFWHGAISDRSPGFATVHALWKLGAIKDYENAFSGNKYRITDLGRRALAEQEGRDDE